MNTKEILIEARNIISDEKNWTQGAEAREQNGDPVSPRCPWAVCFCSIGAVHRAAIKIVNNGFGVYSLDTSRLRTGAVGALAKELKCYTHIDQFNDASTHQEVLALFDRAIANC